MRLRYIILIILLAGVAGGIWYVRNLDKIPPPHVADTSCIQWERTKVTDSLFVIGNNWLRHNPNGLWEMYLEGNGFERGVVYGKLTQDLLEYQEDAFVASINELVPSPSYLNFLRYFVGWFNRKLPANIPEEYLQEIYGVSFSASPKFDFIAPAYLRQLNYHAAHDIGHALQNMGMVACSSFGVWDGRSADSSLLIGRNFDFYVGDRFAKNKLVSFINPDSGHKFMMIGWACMSGVLSGMNEKGLTVTINAAKSDIPLSSATPVSILAREMLQYAATIDEAYAIASKRNVFVSESFLIGSHADNKVVVIEKSPTQIGLYQSVDDQIICTNHFQSETFANDPTNLENINESDSPYRYARMQELLLAQALVDEWSAAAILRDTRGIGGKSIGYGNEKAINQLIAHHAVIFKPSEQKCWVSTQPYQLGKLAAYQMDSIFAGNRISACKDDIPADSLLFSSDYQNFVRYRQMQDSIKAAIQGKMDWKAGENDIQRFVQSNPDMYHVYKLSGDWFLSQKQYEKAVAYWQMALTKEIPRLSEKEYLKTQIDEYNKP